MSTLWAGRQRTPREPDSDRLASLLRVPIVVGLVLSVSIAALISACHGFLDLQVYRVGTEGWLRSGELYGVIRAVAGHTDLPFTYPPSAAVLMIPLALAPLWLAELMVTASSLACLGVTVWLVLSRMRPDLTPRSRTTVAAAAAVGLLALEPVRITLWFGQINLVLMAAVALDCLAVTTRWPRGVLIGIAAVTKLTPAAFVLYFLIRKDWKAAGVAAATAATIVLCGFVLYPRQSSQYWLHTIADTNRIGSPAYVGNQSLKGMVYRFGLSSSAATALWLGIGLVIAAVGAALMHRLFAAERAAQEVARIPASAFAVLALLEIG
ncbi:MAG: DUF2029 domain-containing protein, partial [Mycobacteriaceae bacterium]|nr:DUF2029 domain-containing protein [Mycobacteriaceae bacterium]